MDTEMNLVVTALVAVYVIIRQELAIASLAFSARNANI